ncbi:hypothetical protein [Tengunoibacter tsumagoiensis]|nr:hypothetical protein [Tengunoibacter tsumagoiensis]
MCCDDEWFGGVVLGCGLLIVLFIGCSGYYVHGAGWHGPYQHTKQVQQHDQQKNNHKNNHNSHNTKNNH